MKKIEGRNKVLNLQGHDINRYIDIFIYVDF